MKETTLRERPFEFLRRKDREPFSAETVRNWYIARAYVLEKLKGIAFAPDAEGHLSVIVDGDTPLMLAVVRQIALSAHYLNYEEFDRLGRLSGRNRTVITLVTGMEASEITGCLMREEYLGNLLSCCKHSVFGAEYNGSSFLDIELRIVHKTAGDSEEGVRMDEEDIAGFIRSLPEETVFSIDTDKAIYTNRVYQLGAQVDNLPAEDIHCARRYSHALDTFQYRLLQEKVSPLVDDDRWKKDRIAVENGLSNIFCSDCFETRAACVRAYCRTQATPEKDAWDACIEALSGSEHQRWATEKLIMGYRPLNQEERHAYGRLFGQERAFYVSRLKKDPQFRALIDLCSIRDLRRIDPNSMKYDSIIMLAIPLILEKA
ncbi:MAG: hypothetical protein K6G41_04805 [Bacteroidales bacterium]|nr:hypothetical protein [Bacteroidales bacterium]